MKENEECFFNSFSIAIEDNGSGMSKESIGKLFLNFSKLDNQVENFTGTGLGLSICK